MTFLQPLVVHRCCLLAQENMVCCLLTSTAECFLFGDVQLYNTSFVHYLCWFNDHLVSNIFVSLPLCLFMTSMVIASFHLSFDILDLYSTVLLLEMQDVAICTFLRPGILSLVLWITWKRLQLPSCYNIKSHSHYLQTLWNRKNINLFKLILGKIHFGASLFPHCRFQTN